MVIGCQIDEENTPTDLPTNITSVQLADSIHSSKWELIWQDDFTAFDTSKWNKISAPGGLNNELQIYLAENVYIKDGALRIEANTQTKNGYQYTSGKVTSKNKFTLQYGKVEVRLKAAATLGTQTVFWLLHEACDGVNPCVGNWPPEIDVIEVLGKEPTKVKQVIHYSTRYRGRWPNWDFSSTTTEMESPSLPHEIYHIYAMEWDTNAIRWYIDDQLTKTWIPNNENSFAPNEPMFLVYSIAIGGDLAGSPNKRSDWSQYAHLDWIKVYKSRRMDEIIPDSWKSDTTDIYYIRNAATTHYLTASEATDNPFQLIQAAKGNNWNDQKWRLQLTADGWYILRMVGEKNKVITLSRNSVQRFILTDYQSLETQKWKVVKGAANKVKFTSKLSDTLSISADTYENWSVISQHTNEKEAMNYWYLDPINSSESIN